MKKLRYIPDTYDNLPHDPNQLNETLMFLAIEFTATSEMNFQLTDVVSPLKTTVSLTQQDHHLKSVSYR